MAPLAVADINGSAPVSRRPRKNAVDAVVTARVPRAVRQHGDDILREMGSTPTKLINAAYDYVLKTGELPDVNRGDAPLRITLTDAQANELRFRLRHATCPVPDSFWEDQAALRRAEERRG